MVPFLSCCDTGSDFGDILRNLWLVSTTIKCNVLLQYEGIILLGLFCISDLVISFGPTKFCHVLTCSPVHLDSTTWVSDSRNLFFCIWSFSSPKQLCHNTVQALCTSSFTRLLLWAIVPIFFHLNLVTNLMKKNICCIIVCAYISSITVTTAMTKFFLKSIWCKDLVTNIGRKSNFVILCSNSWPFVLISSEYSSSHGQTFLFLSINL